MIAAMSLPLQLVIRLLAAVLLGALIGYEREFRAKNAGVRTHIMVALGAALFMIISQHGFPDAAKFDAARIAAGVVTGVGFLGGGVIMHQGFNIKGITTAALIWTAAALGLSVGYGFYIPAVVVFVLVILTLPLFKKIERTYFPASRIKTIHLIYSNDDVDMESVKKILTSCGIFLRDINYSNSFEEDKFKVEIIVNTPAIVDFAALGKRLKKTGELAKFSFQ